jgi:hypothetical protein
MRNLLRPAALAATLLVAAGCSGGGAATGSPAVSPSPSGAPNATPSPSTAAADRIDQATGAIDVILRMDQGGGFVAPAFTASQAPVFSLFGDGTVIFRNPMADPLPAVGDTMPNRPFRIARLSEAQIQETLKMAIGQGGLGTARLEYANQMVADAGTTTFAIDAGGLKKTVSVYALGIDTAGAADAPARTAFSFLAQRLRDFDQGGTIRTDEWAPDRYRATLLDGFAGERPPTSWPWADLKPTDFAAAPDPNAMPIPTHTLTATQAAALGITPYQGGFQNLTLVAPDRSKLFSLALRPLLPDETK